jgi:hypothetical protein
MNIAVGNDKIKFEEWISREEDRKIYHEVMKPWNVIGKTLTMIILIGVYEGWDRGFNRKLFHRLFQTTFCLLQTAFCRLKIIIKKKVLLKSL